MTKLSQKLLSLQTFLMATASESPCWGEGREHKASGQLALQARLVRGVGQDWRWAAALPPPGDGGSLCPEGAPGTDKSG